MVIMTNAQFEKAWTQNSYNAVVMTEFNGSRLMGVMEGGMMVVAIAKFSKEHGWMTGASMTVRYVQQARQWFFNTVGYMER